MAKLSNFSAHSIGIEMFHRQGLTINRPRGSGNFVFIHFLTPGVVYQGKRALKEAADTCIIYAPPMAQHYGNVAGTSFGNNWMHFNGPDCQAFLESLELPLNKPFRPTSTAFIVAGLRNINNEKVRREVFWEVGLDVCIRNFFVELARNYIQRGRPMPPRMLELREQMKNLRSRMVESCYEVWTVERMATAVHLSKSRFSVLYRRLFRISPLADLLHMRMELAKYYLGMMQMPIDDVAESCGFSSIYYFCRVFKKMNGITPGRFQKTYSGEDILTPSSTHPVIMERE